MFASVRLPVAASPFSSQSALNPMCDVTECCNRRTRSCTALTWTVFCGKRCPNPAQRHVSGASAGRDRLDRNRPACRLPMTHQKRPPSPISATRWPASSIPTGICRAIPTLSASGTDPLQHFVHHGAAEGRDPNRFFDSAWYLAHYPDVASSGQHPLLHYLQMGAAELRNPHPRFDAAYYVDQHPEAAANPLLYHLRVGVVRGWLTEKPIAIRDYLPADAASPSPPHDVVVDVDHSGVSRPGADPALHPIRARRSGSSDRAGDRGGRSLAGAETVRLARPAGRRGTHRAGAQPAQSGLRRLGQHRHRGGRHHDVVLLNSDTEVPPGWLTRLAGHAYATPRVASVSPFSNNATICGYPRIEAGPPAFGLGVTELDAACRAANGGRSVELPTTVGFCMYIRRAALADVGLFDADAFGRGYGEENDFCLRASARGWRHLLACDTFVYHEGSVSFGAGASAAAEHGHGRAGGALSALRPPGGAAREAGRRRTVPLRRHHASCSAARACRPS